MSNEVSVKQKTLNLSSVLLVDRSTSGHRRSLGEPASDLVQLSSSTVEFVKDNAEVGCERSPYFGFWILGDNLWMK